jgi:hypothetical protein
MIRFQPGRYGFARRLGFCTTHPQYIRLLFAYGWGTCINIADALDWQDLLRLQGISKT